MPSPFSLLRSRSLYICREFFTNQPFFAKQTQFPKSQNERKLILNKVLCKWTRLQSPGKQTQSNPISGVPILQYGAKWGPSDYPCVFELAVYNLILRDGNAMHSGESLFLSPGKKSKSILGTCAEWFMRLLVILL